MICNLLQIACKKSARRLQDFEHQFKLKLQKVAENFSKKINGFYLIQMPELL